MCTPPRPSPPNACRIEVLPQSLRLRPPAEWASQPSHGLVARAARVRPPDPPANTASTITARAYPCIPGDQGRDDDGAAMATPSEEPRLETLRDRPEMSPWSASGKADCTTLTDEVSITPTPRPTSSRPGTKVRTLDVPLTSASSSAMPTMVTTKPARIRVACGNRWASRPAAMEETRMPMVAGVRIRPVSIAL